jgi:lysophospholipase L1-like esterase
MEHTEQKYRILCYGDSNTWGNVPNTDFRYTDAIRWPSRLQTLLGVAKYEVISEGLCGRTFVVQNIEKPHKSGITQLQSILESHDPIDVIIIMLGTNDLQRKYNLTIFEIATHLKQTIELIRRPTLDLLKKPRIIILSPIQITPNSQGNYHPQFTHAAQLMPQLEKSYEEVAKNTQCEFIPTSTVSFASEIDGIHLDEKGHLALSQILYEYLTKA